MKQAIDPNDVVEERLERVTLQAQLCSQIFYGYGRAPIDGLEHTSPVEVKEDLGLYVVGGDLMKPRLGTALTFL